MLIGSDDHDRTLVYTIVTFLERRGGGEAIWLHRRERLHVMMPSCWNVKVGMRLTTGVPVDETVWIAEGPRRALIAMPEASMRIRRIIPRAPCFVMIVSKVGTDSEGTVLIPVNLSTLAAAAARFAAFVGRPGLSRALARTHCTLGNHPAVLIVSEAREGIHSRTVIGYDRARRRPPSGTRRNGSCPPAPARSGSFRMISRRRDFMKLA